MQMKITRREFETGQEVGSAYRCNITGYVQKQHYPALMPGNGAVFSDFCLLGKQ
jgi:hypothetical protein